MTQNPRPVSLPMQDSGVSGSPLRQGAQTDGPKYVLHHGIWHCCLPGDDFHTLCGVGYTPEAAHADWLRMKHKYPEPQADSCVQLKG